MKVIHVTSDACHTRRALLEAAVDADNVSNYVEVATPFILIIHNLFVTVSAISYLFFFFFSSRRRHTRCSRDWSSDVCSSDLLHVHATHAAHVGHAVAVAAALLLFHQLRNHRVGGEHQTGYGRGVLQRRARRSEERRVGKECRSRWSPYH